MSFFGAFGNPSRKIKFNGSEYTQETFLVLFSSIGLFLALWAKFGLTWEVFSVIPAGFVSAYKVECMQTGSCFAFAQYVSLLSFIIAITIIINIYKNRTS